MPLSDHIVAGDIDDMRETPEVSSDELAVTYIFLVRLQPAYSLNEGVQKIWRNILADL